LLGEIIGIEGWQVDKRVRTPGQEIDIIIHKGLDYFFTSSKWEADPVQPKELDEMYARALGAFYASIDTAIGLAIHFRYG
jgi:hypothetical protein